MAAANPGGQRLGGLIATKTTEVLYREASRYLPGGTSRLHYHFDPYPIYARSGSGCHVTDVEGVERLDFLNNMTSLMLGHANPGIAEALRAQIERGTAFSEPCEAEVDLAKLMVERVLSIEKIRFTNSGTEAVMYALKLARAYTGRSKVAKFEGFYHGYYDYVQVSYSFTPANWGPADAPASTASSGGLSSSVLGEVLVLPFNDRLTVEKLLKQHASSIAALILDPLSNRAGFPLPDEGFYGFLRELTRDLGIVLIFDEVISFRLASGGAQSIFGGEPDITAFGKIIGGGLPVGAVGGSDEIMELLDPTGDNLKLMSGGTFSANPMTMVAGLATMRQLTPEVYQCINALDDKMREDANEVFRASGIPGQLTGYGSLFRILTTAQPVRSYRDSVNGASSEVMSRLHRGLLNEGVIVGNNGLGTLSMPMNERQTGAFCDALARTLAKIQNMQ